MKRTKKTKTTKPRYRTTVPPAPLTEAGWPRPFVETNIGKLPVPWSAPPNQLSVNREERSDISAKGEICQICGLPHRKGHRAYSFVRNDIGKKPRKNSLNLVLMAMDKAVIHARCARLALRFCPRLKELSEKRKLEVYSVPSFFGCEFPIRRVKKVTEKFIK